MGAHLAAVTSVYEQLWLTSQIADSSHVSDTGNFWIGLGAYISDTGSLDYSWTTGEPVDLTVWDVGQPSMITIETLFYNLTLATPFCRYCIPMFVPVLL